MTRGPIPRADVAGKSGSGSTAARARRTSSARHRRARAAAGTPSGDRPRAASRPAGTRRRRAAGARRARGRRRHSAAAAARCAVPRSHERTGHLAEVLRAGSVLAAAAEPRRRVDQRLAAAATGSSAGSRSERAGPRSPARGVQRLAERHSCHRDQAEPVDGPVVGADGQPSAVVAHGDPQQRSAGVAGGGQRGASCGPLLLAHHLDLGCGAEVRVGGAQRCQPLGAGPGPGRGRRGRRRSPSWCPGRRRARPPRGLP